jgi:hypothetical protein
LINLLRRSAPDALDQPIQAFGRGSRFGLVALPIWGWKFAPYKSTDLAFKGYNFVGGVEDFFQAPIHFSFLPVGECDHFMASIRGERFDRKDVFILWCTRSAESTQTRIMGSSASKPRVF